MRDSGTAVRSPLRETATAVRRRRWALRDLRLRKRLTLLVLVPLVVGVALASVRVVSESATIGSEDALNGQARVALSLAGLVYAVEDERDTVQIYLTDGQQASDLATLTKAEAATGSEIDAFDAAQQAQGPALADLAPSVRTLMQQAVARLGDLPTLRQSVTSLGAGRPIYQAYTTIIGDLLNFGGQLSTETTDHTMASLVSTLGLVQQAGEESSQERGYLVGILGGSGELLAQQEDLVQAQAQYNSDLSQIEAQAPAAIATLYQADVGGDQTGAADSTVQQTIDAALQNRPVAEIGESGTAAYAEMTAKINQIRAIESVVGQDILDRTGALIGSAREDLYLNLGVIVAVLLLAFVATAVIARSITRPLLLLRSSALEIAEVRLPAVIQRLRDPAQAQTRFEVEPIAIDSTDEIGSVARAFDEVHHAAVHLAGEQALLRASVNAVFTNLSRRSQTLVERQLSLIDDLESGEREPGRLSQLFRLDHLATRMRRNNENLLVLAGEETARRWTEAVRLVDVARAAVAEVEQYERVILGEMPRVGIVGKAAPDIAHLVAELLENATVFSAPHTKVWIAARPAEDGGVVVRIEDAGIGMKRAELDEANERIDNPPVVDVSVARRMGLYVVGRLAARYAVRVRLGESQAGGVAARIHLPAALLTHAVGDPPPSRSQVDDEFYALSRQLSQGANHVAGPAGAPEGALDQDPWSEAAGPPLFGDSRTSTVAAPMVPWPSGRGERPGPAPWYEPPAPKKDDFWFLPSEDRKARDRKARERAGRDPVAEDRAARDHTGQHPVGQYFAGQQAADQQPGDQQPAGRHPEGRHPAAPSAVPAVPRARRPAPRHAPPAPAEPAEARPPEPTPIFQAIESEWFRRREQARAAVVSRAPAAAEDVDAQAARDVNGNGHAAASALAQQAAAAPAAPPETSPAAPEGSWSSPGDDGWRAARAVTDPVQDGQTRAGLPKRLPRANLVPGRAGGTGAAKAVPPSRLRRGPENGGKA